MAWRLHEHVLHGEIDNRTRDHVRGRVWLAGVDQPLELDLVGNCQHDLAGCLLKFENPHAFPMTTKPPALHQRGHAGFISASRKVRVFDVPADEAYLMLKRGETPPEHLANSIYIEWYSELAGRIVIESADYRLDISQPEWCFSEEEIADQKRKAAEEETPFAIESHADGTREDWDEFRCEQLLRESDLIGEKYRRLLEQYGDHPDQERIIAREMGWTWLEEALDAQGEDGITGTDSLPSETHFDEAFAAPEETLNPEREGIDWVRDDRENGRLIHPIAKHARDTLYALFGEMKTGDDDLADSDPLVGEFVGHFMTLSVKLSSALNFIARPERHLDRGMVIAWLKRALEIHNQTLTAAAALPDHERFGVDRQAFYREELFRIREGVLEVISELRGAVE